MKHVQPPVLKYRPIDPKLITNEMMTYHAVALKAELDGHTGLAKAMRASLHRMREEAEAAAKKAA